MWIVVWENKKCWFPGNWLIQKDIYTCFLPKINIFKDLVRKSSLKLYFLGRYYVSENDVSLGNKKYTLAVKKIVSTAHFLADMRASRFWHHKKVETFFCSPHIPGNLHLKFSQTTIHIISWDFVEHLAGNDKCTITRSCNFGRKSRKNRKTIYILKMWHANVHTRRNRISEHHPILNS